MWIEGEAAVWWRTVMPHHPLSSLTWPVLRQLLVAQFTPIDALRRARDAWAACVQGKGTVRTYIDTFRRCLLHVADAAPAEILDRFLRGLSTGVRAQVLITNPADFTAAALTAERVAGAHGEPTRAMHAPAAPTHSGPVPMELGAAVHTGPGAPARATCHHCGKPGHFKADCRALDRELRARRNRGNRPTASAN